MVTEFAPADEESNYPTAIAQADGAGVATAIWSDRGLRSAQRAGDGSWSEPVTVASCPDNFLNCVTNYSLIVDVNGNATAAWTDWDASYVNHVYVASRPAAGTWSAPHLLATGRSATGGINGADPWLSTGRNGTVLLTYNSWSRATGNAVAVVYRPPGVQWSAARTRLFAHAQQASSGVSDRGVAVMVVRGTGARDNHMRSYRYRPGIGWGPARKLGVARHYDRAPYCLGVGTNGRAVLAYLYDPTRAPDVVGSPVLRARIMNRLGRWGRSRTLSRPGAVTSETPLSTIRGTATVLWSTNHNAIREATKRPGHPWGVHTAYPRRSGQVMTLDRNFRGDIVLLWQHWSSSANLYAGIRTASGQWSDRIQIPERTDDTFAWGSPLSLPDGSGIVFTNDFGGTAGAITFRALARTLTPAP